MLFSKMLQGCLSVFIGFTNEYFTGDFFRENGLNWIAHDDLVP